jgi:predicted DNA-binding transcriptional regulator YafY
VWRFWPQFKKNYQRGPAMRGQTLIKLFKAVELFAKSDGTTIRDLQETLKIDRKSVYRLISTMEDLGFPLTDKSKNKKGQVLI